MNVLPSLALLLGCVSLGLGSRPCIIDGEILICEMIPSTFQHGFVSMVILQKNVGEINSTVFHSDNLVTVTRLTIDDANITGIASGAFASLKNLQTLGLNHNTLTRIDPSWLGQPAVLRHLSLVDNNIKGLDESMLSGLTGLTKLNLTKNMIRTIHPGTFSSQTHLTELDLSGNRMTQVAPQVFRSLGSTRISLDGNPWDCSCGVEGFVMFLKDLQNRSLLEREMNVTCENPASLRGVPVWNVSVCVTTTPPETSPSQPPPETSPSLPTPWTETSVHPEKLTNKSITIPTLIGIIVALCVLLCVVCSMAALYRRKRESVTVMPRPLKEDREKSEDDSAVRHPKSSDLPEKRDFIETSDGDVEIAWRSPVRGIRAKSASAVLLTSPFCAAVKDQTKIEDPSEDAKTSAEENYKFQDIIQEVGSSQLENANHTEAEKDENHNSGVGGNQNTDKNTPCVSVNIETAPYLSIGTDQHKPNPVLNEGLDSSGQRSQVGKVLGRISTWPPTSIDWQARCSTRREEMPSVFMCIPHAPTENTPTPLEFISVTKKCQGEMEQLSSIDALESGNKIGIQGDTPKETQMPDLLAASPMPDPVQPQIKELLTESRHSQSHLVATETFDQENFTTEVACSKQNETTESRSHNLITNYSPFSEAQTHSYTDLTQEEEWNHSPEMITHQDPASEGQFTMSEGQTELKNRNQNQAELCQSQDPQPGGSGQRSMTQDITKTNSRVEFGRDKKRAQTRESHSSRRQRSTGSRAPSGGASAGDNSLMSSDERACIDLLHEVAQNHGRWTRDRWKQMHLNKQQHKQQGQGR